MAGRHAALLRHAEYRSDDGEAMALARLALSLSSKGLHDRRILGAIEILPRSLFVAAAHKDRAFDDRPIPIECGQTCDAPSVLGLVYQAAEIASEHRLLQVGTGSGWGTAILAGLCTKVYTIERFRTLADLAVDRFAALGLDNVVPTIQDGLDLQSALDELVVWDAAHSNVPALLQEHVGDVGGSFQGMDVVNNGYVAFPNTGGAESATADRYLLKVTLRNPLGETATRLFGPPP